MPTSLGAHSPRLAAARELATKTGRRAQGRFLIEGATLLDEAIRSGAPIEAVFVTSRGHDALGEPGSYGAAVYVIPERAMARLSLVSTPPGVVAVLKTATLELDSLLDGRGPLMLLAGIADPGNAGTLLRSAEIFGFGGAIFASDGVEAYNPKVVRASMGAIFRLPIAIAPASEVVDAAARANYMVIATSRDGVPLSQFRFQRRSIVAIGSERRGVAGWLPTWDESIAIPHFGAGESLNAAIAGSIVAYAAAEQLGGLQTTKKR